MRKSTAAIFAVAVALLFFLPSFSVAAQKKATKAPELKGWYLIWNDEFTGEKVDRKKWYIEDAALVKNNELQYYTPKNVYTKNGKLVLKSDKETMGGRAYTSGLVETKGRFTFQYGRVEVRAKLPGTKGLWPAHWMMPERGSWPPEIDIMELVGSKPNVIHMTNHYGVHPHNRYDTRIFAGPDYTKDFHVYALEWDESELRWFIDGVQRSSVSRNVPREPFYIILNTAVGGIMPGNPDATTVFPQYHEIDYVRVYAKEIPGTFFLMTSAENGKVAADPRLPRYDKGDKVKLTAVPKIGYKFAGWMGDPSLGANNPARVLMTKHKNISAFFVEDPDAPKLLSRGREASASTFESEAMPAKYVTDGDMNSRWSSEFFDPQWVSVDLGKPCIIEAIRLEWETAGARGYKIQVSDDGKQWETFYSTDNASGGTEEIMGLNTVGRHVRVYGTERRTKYGYSLWEFEVFGKEAP